MIFKILIDPYTVGWQVFNIAIVFVGYVFFAYLLSFIIFMIFEKPIMNISSAIFLGRRDHNQKSQQLERQLSTLSDPDREILHIVHEQRDEGGNFHDEENELSVNYQRLE